jgi:hypothetical protein
VTIGLGGLLVLAASAGARVDEASRVDTALTNLQVVLETLSRRVDLQAQSISDDGILLAVPVNGGVAVLPPLQVAVRLEESDQPSAHLLMTGGALGTVGLGVFEHSSLEYLFARAGAFVWGGGSAVGPLKVVAVRLRLELHHRVWRPLIWIESARFEQAVPS